MSNHAADTDTDTFEEATATICIYGPGFPPLSLTVSDDILLSDILHTFHSARVAERVEDLGPASLRLSTATGEMLVNALGSAVGAAKTIADARLLVDASESLAFHVVLEPYIMPLLRLHLFRFKETFSVASSSIFRPFDGDLAINCGSSLVAKVIAELDHASLAPEKTSSESTTSTKSKISAGKVPSHLPSTVDPKAQVEALCLNVSTLDKKITLDKYLVAPYVPPTLPYKALLLSAFHPPPAERRSRGDLIYLCFESLEGPRFEITCHVSGFYINLSSPNFFDPKPSSSSATHHALPALLAAVSPAFSTTPRIPSDHVSYVPNLNSPWITKAPAPLHPNDTALDAFILAQDFLETPINFNEDMQSLRTQITELESNIQEKEIQEMVFNRTYNEFLEFACQSAKKIVEGSVTPYNHLDPREKWTWLVNNVLFTIAEDEKTHKRLGMELSSTTYLADFLSRKPELGLSTFPCFIMDYQGSRFLVQALRPGLLDRLTSDGNDLVKYGRTEDGVWAFSEEIHARMASVARFCKAAERECLIQLEDGEERQVKVWGNVQVKTFDGGDGRAYLIDLAYTSPIDVDFLAEVEDYPHDMAFFRREALTSFWTIKAQEHVNGVVKKTPTEEKAKGEEQNDLDMTVEQALKGFNLDFNFNIGDCVVTNAAVDPEVLENDKKVLNDLHNFVKTELTMACLRHCVNSVHPVVDGESLTRVVHTFGVPMRYLGLMAKNEIVHSKKWLKDLIVEEMVMRALKRILREYLRSSCAWLRVDCAAWILGCAFKTPSIKFDVEWVKKFSGPVSETFRSVTSESLWSRVLQEIQKRFQYDLPCDFEFASKARALRNLCMKVGLQLNTKDYFAHGATFKTEDVLNLAPVIKTMDSKMSIVLESRDAAGECFRSGQSQIAQELLYDAINQSERVLSVHPEVARSYIMFLDKLEISLSNVEPSIEMQQKAVQILERTLGLDHIDTLRAYTGLGDLLIIGKRFRESTNCFTHVCQMWRAGYDAHDHPYLIEIYAKLAAICLRMDLKEQSVDIYTRASQIAESIHGPNSAATTHMQRSLMALEVSRGNFKKALGHEKVVYNFYKNLVGLDDEKTKESAQYLSVLIQRAVDEARNDQENAKTLSRKKVAAVTENSRGDLYVDQLIEFIGETVPCNAGKKGRR